jgi:hypothetical protein
MGILFQVPSRSQALRGSGHSSCNDHMNLGLINSHNGLTDVHGTYVSYGVQQPLRITDFIPELQYKSTCYDIIV